MQSEFAMRTLVTVEHERRGMEMYSHLTNKELAGLVVKYSVPREVKDEAYAELKKREVEKAKGE